MPGYPIRKSSDHSSADSSPRHIAASHVLHRLLMPRHPPYALTHLPQTHSTSTTQQDNQDARVHYALLKEQPHTKKTTPPHQPPTRQPAWTGPVLSGPNSAPPPPTPPQPPTTTTADDPNRTNEEIVSVPQIKAHPTQHPTGHRSGKPKQPHNPTTRHAQSRTTMASGLRPSASAP